MSGPPNGTPSGGQVLRKVGDYELISKLGQGAMGAVFKARQGMLDRIVALKVLPPSIAKDQNFIERFVREARASAKLSHPNVVAGIDVGQDEATKLWYFAMEYVDGPTVKQMQDRQARIPEDDALKIARDIANALDCAHQAGMVHRDVKPDNILMMSDGTAKLADLGLARQTHEDSSLTQSGQALGTPYYMAPEQARGENETLDTRADLYALGATLFHMVTGVPPFTGETAAVIMAKHLTEAPPLAQRVNPEVSQGCSRLIQRLMQKDKTKRFQTPAELVEQIEGLLKLPVEARAGTTGPRRAVLRDGTGAQRTVRGTTAAQDVVRGRRSREGEPEPAGGNKLPLIMGGVAGFVVVVVIGVFAFAGNGSPERVAKKDAPAAAPSLAPVLPPDSSPDVVASNPPEKKQPPPTTHKIVPPVEPAKKAAPPVPPVHTVAPPVQPPVAPTPDPARAVAAWRPLFDGKSLTGWTVVNVPPPLFGKGRAELDDGKIILQQGGPCSGIRFAGKLPHIDYEIDCEAMRLAGPDAFLLIKFPVAESSVILVLGGFKNTVVGLDQVDGQPSNANLTKREMVFRNEHWYGIRIRVTKTHITASIDDQPVVHLAHTQHRLTTTDWLRPLGMLGLASWECRTAVRRFRIGELGAEVAAAETKPPVTPAVTPPEKPVPPPPEAEGVLSEKTEAAYQAVLKEAAPLQEGNRLDEAITLFDRKAREPVLKEAAKLLDQEKVDMQAVLAMREAAIEALRQMAGQTVKLRMGKRVEAGKVVADPKRAGVTLSVMGAEMTIQSDRLAAENVDQYAPKAAGGDALRHRGVLFLYAGDAAKAKACFAKAQEAGATAESLQIYLDRIAVAELGEAEAAAAKLWKRAEELFAQKRLKEAEPLYLALREKHSATKVHAENAERLTQRLTAIAQADKPKVVFVPEESMKPEAAGHRQMIFPVQESDDATDPFRNKAMYFDQRTGKDVVYRVLSPRPMAGLRWRGAAMQNMTIEVLDPNGKVLGQGGPYQGSNKWAEFMVAFQPSREFTLRFRNHISRWYLIAELELFPEGVPLPPPKSFAPPGPHKPPGGPRPPGPRGPVPPGVQMKGDPEASGTGPGGHGALLPSTGAGKTIAPETLLPMLNTAVTGHAWRVEGDALAGTAGSIDGAAGKVLTKEPFKARAFEYGLKMIAKRYQALIVTIDGQQYFYSRGHWHNTGGFLLTPDGPDRRRGRETVADPDEWATLEAALAGDLLVFRYNGEVVAKCPVKTNPGREHEIHVGFGSHETPVTVRDFSLTIR